MNVDSLAGKLNRKIDLSDFKLIIFDIDGTLVGPSHILDPYTHSILLRLRDYGIPYTLATGKNLPATRHLADDLIIDLPLVLSNGSMIETRQGKILAKSVLPPEVIRSVIEICETCTQNLVFYIDNDIIIKEMNDDIYGIYDQVADSITEIGDWKKISNRFAEVNKCLVVEQHIPQNLVVLEGIFKKALSEKSDILFSSTKLLEVLPKGITKVTGIKKLANSLVIEMSEVMAFGDYDNDVEMLTAVGLGVVVENGSAAAKASADLIIGSCAQNGPAKFLQELMASL